MAVRAIIVASGNLDDLPAEIQTVANVLSAAGWTVRLCIGADASRAGLLAAAGEGDVDLAWFGWVAIRFFLAFWLYYFSLY